MVDLVGNMNKVVEDNTQLFKWTVDDYLTPIPAIAWTIDRLNPDINLSLKEMLKGFSQTVEAQSGGFKSALDGFISPVADLKSGIEGAGVKVRNSLIDLTGTMGKVIDDAAPVITGSFLPIPQAVEKTGQDVATAGSGSGGPVEAMKAVLTGIEQVIDAETGVITAKLNALLSQINSILSQIGQAVASLSAIGSGSGPGSAVSVPGSEPNPGSRSRNPDPAGSGGGSGGGGGSFQPVATASQITNMYNNSLSSSSNATNNSPVVKNYNLTVNSPIQSSGVIADYDLMRLLA
jgi:hypothetical protein